MRFQVKYVFQPKAPEDDEVTLVPIYRWPCDSFVAPSRGVVLSATLYYMRKPVARARPSTPMMAGEKYRYDFKYEDMLR